MHDERDERYALVGACLAVADGEGSVIYLLDTSEELDTCADELGVPRADVGQFITPLTRFSNWGGRFAVDNGGFTRRDSAGFLSLLAREKPHRGRCLFVVLPDVVCDARRTLELYREFCYHTDLRGWPLALALQNGIEYFDLPWDRLKAVFIGGDDAFKGSDPVRAVIAAAQWRGVWTHMGRVNTPGRVALAKEMGCDSIDGTGLSRYTHMRRAAAWQTIADLTEAAR